MNAKPIFFKLLGSFMGISIAISIALGTGFGLVGVITAIALNVSRSTRSGGARALPAFALPLTFVLVLLVGLFSGNASLGETVSFAAAILGIGLLGGLLLLSTRKKKP